jgi:hypothetical protein
VSKLCSVTHIVPGGENGLIPCTEPAAKKCEKCGAAFCEEHAKGSMVGELCRKCAPPGAGFNVIPDSHGEEI